MNYNFCRIHKTLRVTPAMAAGDGSTLVNQGYGAGAGGMGEYNLAEARMLVIWLGALFVLGGLLFMVAQPIWRGRLGDAKRTSPGVPRDTLEPRRPGAGFYTESELAWPRIYRARWHSLINGGWPVAEIAVFQIEALPSRVFPNPKGDCTGVTAVLKFRHLTLRRADAHRPHRTSPK